MKNWKISWNRGWDVKTSCEIIDIKLGIMYNIGTVKNPCFT